MALTMLQAAQAALSLYPHQAFTPQELYTVMAGIPEFTVSSAQSPVATLGSVLHGNARRMPESARVFGFYGTPHKFYLLSSPPADVDSIETSQNYGKKHRIRLQEAKRELVINTTAVNRLLLAAGISGDTPIIVRAVRNALLKELGMHPDLGGETMRTTAVNKEYTRLQKELGLS